MSHIGIYTTAIQNPDPGLLRATLEAVAQSLQGQVQTHYLDWYQNRHAVLGAIFTPILGRGIGVQINAEGGLEFVGDFWGVQQQAQAVQNEVINTYQALAVMQAMQAMGYSVQRLAQAQNCIAFEGVAA
jgi:hypothetical protein